MFYKLPNTVNEEIYYIKYYENEDIIYHLKFFAKHKDYFF